MITNTLEYDDDEASRELRRTVLRVQEVLTRHQIIDIVIEELAKTLPPTEKETR